MEKATPLLRLEENLFAKAEFENPTGSVKDRPAGLILAHVPPGATVIEATSGNFGISLGSICKKKGLRCILVMPESMSEDRRALLRSWGAEVILTPAPLGMAGAMETARELAKEIPGSFLPGQFTNPRNPLAHYQTTGPEIWSQADGRIDIFVAGVGTGGSVGGIGRYLREKNPDIQIVAVEPAASPLLRQGRSGQHGIQGIGANFYPPLLKDFPLDQVVPVSDEDAFATAKAWNALGLPVGLSAGANLWAARLFAARGYRTVTLLPDHKNRYTSLGL